MVNFRDFLFSKKIKVRTIMPGRYCHISRYMLVLLLVVNSQDKRRHQSIRKKISEECQQIPLFKIRSRAYAALSFWQTSELTFLIYYSTKETLHAVFVEYFFLFERFIDVAF